MVRTVYLELYYNKFGITNIKIVMITLFTICKLLERMFPI